MKRLAVLLVGSLLAVQTVWATDLPIDPASCQSLNTGSASCNKELYDHRLTASGQDDVRSCPAAATYGFVCKFQWPAANPAQVIPYVFWDVGYGGATTGSACWRTSIGCTATGDEYHTRTWGTATTVSDATHPAPTVMNRADLPSTTPYNAAANSICKIKVERAAGVGGCTNDLLDPTRVLWLQLHY